MMQYRKNLEEKEKQEIVKVNQHSLLKQQQIVLNQKQQKLEVISSSTVSISEEAAIKNNFHSSQFTAAGGVSGGKLRKT